MTRHRAWFAAAVVTASGVALVVGIGATFGQFGFGKSGGEASGVVAERVFPVGAGGGALPVLVGIDEDEAVVRESTDGGKATRPSARNMNAMSAKMIGERMTTTRSLMTRRAG